MKIKNIQLKNVRNFDERVFNFVTKSNKDSSVIAILGDNGSGKSTILKSIVSTLSLYNPIYGGTIFDQSDIRTGESFYRIELSLILNQNERTLLFEEENETNEILNIRVGKVISEENGAVDFFQVNEEENAKNTFSKIRNTFCSNNFNGGYVFYFDPFRYLPNEELEGPNSNLLLTNPRKNALSSSILDGEKLNNKFLHIKQWLINLDFKRLKSPSKENEAVFRHVTEAFNRLFQPYYFEKINDNGQILFRHKENIIEIDKLSEGFKNLFIIIGEIFFRLYLTQAEDIKFYEKEAVIIIDEIDCHIHPKWQVNIIPYLKQMFPNCQFIVTTHSPFIISQLSESEIIKLEDGVSV
ncbi:AAA family ATPase [Bacillus rhizoplanae]|uniref:AAA family ATPase n=1 Tax=Bacillus rhizoplanae TaxID=2880966 RepID=UPI003D1DFDCD